MMESAQKAFLLKHFDAKSWYGKSPHGVQVFKAAALEDVKVRNWKKQQSFAFKKRAMLVTRSLWSCKKSFGALLSVEQIECSSIIGAHRALLEILADIESGAVKRDRTSGACGDVAFVLDQTMYLFAHANVIIWIRNKGPTVVTVSAMAKGLDKALIQGFNRQKRERSSALAKSR